LRFLALLLRPAFTRIQIALQQCYEDSFALWMMSWRRGWTMPILVFGMNAIAGFVADSLVYGPGYSFTARGPTGRAVSWHEAAQARLESIVPGAANASLLYSIAAALFCWILLWLLWRSRAARTERSGLSGDSIRLCQQRESCYPRFEGSLPTRFFPSTNAFPVSNQSTDLPNS